MMQLIIEKKGSMSDKENGTSVDFGRSIVTEERKKEWLEKYGPELALAMNNYFFVIFKDVTPQEKTEAEEAFIAAVWKELSQAQTEQNEEQGKTAIAAILSITNYKVIKLYADLSALIGAMHRLSV